VVQLLSAQEKVNIICSSKLFFAGISHCENEKLTKFIELFSHFGTAMQTSDLSSPYRLFFINSLWLEIITTRYGIHNLKCMVKQPNSAFLRCYYVRYKQLNNKKGAVRRDSFAAGTQSPVCLFGLTFLSCACFYVTFRGEKILLLLFDTVAHVLFF